MKKIWLIVGIIWTVSIIMSIAFYSQLPEKVDSHWNAQGEVNGQISKFWGAFLSPVLILGIFLLFYIIPKIDPLKDNIKKFQNVYHGLILVIIIFLFLIHLQTLLWNSGVKINPANTTPAIVGLIFLYLGFTLKKLKRNWFIGIRTPWTISSDMVWKKTHELGSKLFLIVGIITLTGLLFPTYSFWLLLVPVFASVLILFVYSYLEYRKEKR